MTVEMDPEVAAAMGPIAEAAAAQIPPPAGDWQTRRAVVDELISAATGSWTPRPDVTVTDYAATADDGATIGLRLYRREGDQPGSLAVYVHGGGMFLCSIDTHDPICRMYTHLSGVPLLSVDFRFAPSTRTRPRSRTSTPRCAGPPRTPRSSAWIRPASRSWVTPRAGGWRPRSR